MSIQILLKKLELGNNLSSAGLAAIERLPVKVVDCEPRQPIVLEDDRPTFSVTLLKGFLCRTKIGSGGRQQILSVHVPGDMPDLQSIHLPRMDFSLVALSRSQVGLVSHERVRDLFEDHTDVANAFWRETLIDAAIFREWIFSIGQRDADERIAHFIAEVQCRLQAVGMATPTSFEWPLTQQDIADAMGLTAIHTNRVLKQLRQLGAVEINRSTVIYDLSKLHRAGGFDPQYLSLGSRS